MSKKLLLAANITGFTLSITYVICTKVLFANFLTEYTRAILFPTASPSGTSTEIDGPTAIFVSAPKNNYYIFYISLPIIVMAFIFAANIVHHLKKSAHSVENTLK